MAQETVLILKKALEANNNERYRKGNIINLPASGKLIVSGDIHGHQRNFEKILKYADLENNPKNHILFQELIHGGPQDEHGGCMSYKILLDAVSLKLKYPRQIHFILANHDTAFINNSEVMKDGKEMNRSMRQALQRHFKNDVTEVNLAIKQFLFSQPLAIRCENRIWISHSLPADKYIDKFEIEIFKRPLKVHDVVRPGSAYTLTWGRRHSQKLLDKFAQMLDVDLFILGHQPQKNGWAQKGDNLLIVSSEHNHGSILPIDLKKKYSIGQLIDQFIPLATLS
jgi:hypothetical protein